MGAKETKKKKMPSADVSDGHFVITRTLLPYRLEKLLISLMQLDKSITESEGT
jgi:hypothetical protein